ncbi:MAG: tetraacyldisaccharide 4'-kinase [Gammaproteobacteria bacterium]|nr:tetraacyldisaccharide 4'-kinase [Gammaproteobacteria bacterium]
MDWLQKHWEKRTALRFLLIPASWLYRLLAASRRGCYKVGLMRVTRVPAPVVVVGNISVGGTGKTPLVLWLSKFLTEQGFQPGIVLRGYGGHQTDAGVIAGPGSDPAVVGDEALLLARNSSCPVFVSRNRARAAQMLVRDHDCNVILSDDGLQHYAMARDVEIAVIDGDRRFGNGHQLPAGPLRESPKRLLAVDICVVNGRPHAGELGMQLAGLAFHQVTAPETQLETSAFRGQRVHAVAGIGCPQRFFSHLRDLGIEAKEHPFPDHYQFTAQDIEFNDDWVVIMTEKDAVKCEQLADQRHWYLAVAAKPDPKLGMLVLKLLKERFRGQEAT